MTGGTRRDAAAAALALAAAAGLAACHPAKFGENRLRDRPVAVAERLDCPAREGGLERTSQAPDGRSCAYRGGDDEEVTLAFLPLDGKPPGQALQPTEAGLRALLPAPGAAPAGGDARASADGDDDGDRDKDEHDDAGAAAAARPPSAVPPGGRGDHVAINLPGVHIDANDGGATIHAFGQNVVADDHGATVQGSAGGMKTEIKADDGGAEIRAGFVGKNAVDLTYILASDDPGPSGVHAAAYVARGPVSGPLVLATSRLKAGDRHVDQDRFHDLRRLVARNVKRAG